MYMHYIFAIVIAGRYLHTHDVGGRITTAAGSKDKIVPWIMQRFHQITQDIRSTQLYSTELVLHDITIYYIHLQLFTYYSIMMYYVSIMCLRKSWCWKAWVLYVCLPL